MKKFVYILIFITACTKSPFDFLIEEGKSKSETRQLAAFNKLVVKDIFDIKLIEDTVLFIELTAGSNILPHITSTIESGTLTLDNSIKGRWARPYHRPSITLHVSNLSEINLNEACNLSASDSIHSNYLFLFTGSDLASVDICITGSYFDFANRHSTSGHCIFRGKVQKAKLFSGGTTKVDASNLITDSVVIFHNSVADMHVRVNTKIKDLRNFKKGNLFIYGNPKEINYKEKKDSVNVFFRD